MSGDRGVAAHAHRALRVLALAPLALFAVVLFAAALLPAVPVRAQEIGRGKVGEWTLVWRMSETDVGINRFRKALGPKPEFPFRARLLDRMGQGPRVVLFDGDGDAEGEIKLAPDERALVAISGDEYLLWHPDPLSQRRFVYRFFRMENPEPVWETSAPGEPALLAPDGSFFVITARDTATDRFQRAWLRPGGRVQIVSANGEIRGEMPILPAFVRLTGDGQRIAMLHDDELVVLKRDGILDWTEPVPIDAIVAREGHSQLEAAGGKIVVSGTGESPVQDTGAASFHADRRGTLRVYTDEGDLLWKTEQSEQDELWFQIALALSRDGETLAAFHSGGRDIAVRLFDARSGDAYWETKAPRLSGTSSLSISPDGQLVVLAHAGLRTQIVAWNREGDVVWDGEIPYGARVVRVSTHGLLVADRWIVRLELAGG